MSDDRLRLPPQNLDAELGVLGSILLMNEAIDEVGTWLKAEHFYSDAHQKVYTAIQDLYERRVRGIDAVTLAEELVRRGEFEDVGSTAYLVRILEAVPHPAHCAYYATIVREKWIVRSTIYASTATMQECYDPTIEPAEILQNAERRLSAISESHVASETRELADVNMDAIERIKKRRENKGQLSGVTTGFTDLDRITTGMQASELIILAARPSMGKTAMVCRMAHSAAKAGNRVLIFSLEQSELDLSERILAQAAGVNSHSLRSGNVTDDELTRLANAQGKMRTMPFVIDDTPDRSIRQISTIARREHRRNGLGLVLIDYLQLIGPEDKSAPREQQIAGISRALKCLARELSIPVLALAQLNRGVENRDDKTPRLADLRESGAIEQDADVVLMLHRPDAYDAEDRPGEAELIIAKNRSCPRGTVRLRWNAASMLFSDYVHAAAEHEYYFASDRN